MMLCIKIEDFIPLGVGIRLFDYLSRFIGNENILVNDTPQLWIDGKVTHSFPPKNRRAGSYEINRSNPRLQSWGDGERKDKTVLTVYRRS